MEDTRLDRKKRKTIVAIIATASVAVIIFLCIFSLYHLPTRNPVETPEMAVDPNYTEPTVSGIEETNDVMSASQEQVSEMLGDLELQYENAKVNNEPYQAEEAGLRLALAYWKVGQTQQAKEFTGTLIQTYSYDTSFVEKCKELLKTINTSNP